MQFYFDTLASILNILNIMNTLVGSCACIHNTMVPVLNEVSLFTMVTVLGKSGAEENLDHFF